MNLTDDQWARLDPSIPEPPRRADGRGRPWTPRRPVLDGVLWILRTGAQWQELPARSPPPATVHRRFQAWVRDGTLERVLAALATDWQERGGIAGSEWFVDGTFVGAKKGAAGALWAGWERPSGATVRSAWQGQSVLVFQSPCARRALRRMQSRSSPPC